jgi:hypothetical protein
MPITPFSRRFVAFVADRRKRRADQRLTLPKQNQDLDRSQMSSVESSVRRSDLLDEIVHNNRSQPGPSEPSVAAHKPQPPPPLNISSIEPRTAPLRVSEEGDPFAGEGTKAAQIETQTKASLAYYYRDEAAGVSDTVASFLLHLKNIDIFLSIREELKTQNMELGQPEDLHPTLGSLVQCIEEKLSTDNQVSDTKNMMSAECTKNLWRGIKLATEYSENTSRPINIIIITCCRTARHQILMRQGLIALDEKCLLKHQEGLDIMLGEADQVDWKETNSYGNLLTRVAEMKNGTYFVEDDRPAMMNAHKATALSYLKKPVTAVADVPEKSYEINAVNASWRTSLHAPILGIVASISAMIYLRKVLKNQPGPIGFFALSSQLINLLYKGHNLKYCNTAADLLEGQIVQDISVIGFSDLVESANVAGYNNQRYAEIETLEGKKKVLQLREKCRDLHAFRFEAQSKVPTAICAVIGSALGSSWAYRTGNQVAGIFSGVIIGCLTLSELASSRYTWPGTSNKPEFESKVAKLLSQGHTSAQVASEMNSTKPRRTKWLCGVFPGFAAYISSPADILREDVDAWAKIGGYKKPKSD